MHALLDGGKLRQDDGFPDDCRRMIDGGIALLSACLGTLHEVSRGMIANMFIQVQHSSSSEWAWKMKCA